MSTLAEVITAAGVGDPWERAREVADADPGAVVQLAGRYRVASETAGVALRAAERADTTTAGGYQVEGVPVHDATAATAATRQALGDGGEHAGQVAQILTLVADELGTAKSGVGGELTALDAELRAINALTAGPGPVPADVADALERAVFDAAVAAVRTHGGRINQQLDGYAAVLASRTGAVRELGYQAPVEEQAAGVPPPPAGGSPIDNRRWWDSLTDQQRQDLLTRDPELVGNLDGIPAVVRDAANRSRIGAETARLDAEIADTQARLDAATYAAIENPYDPDAELPSVLMERLSRLRNQQSALAAVERAVEPGGRQLLLLDLDGHDAPRAAVAVGDVDTANHVAVFTPGLNSTVGGSLEGYTRDVDALVATGQEQLVRGGRTDEKVAAVAWIGYDAPQLDGSTLNPRDSVLEPFAAKRGAEPLAGFLDGINASRPGHDPHLTAVAHSYGSTTTGYALQRTTSPVDDLVVFGSPGLGADQVSDLRVPADHVYELEARKDPVADAGLFGTDPNHLDGVRSLSAQDEQVNGQRLRESVGHSEYLTPGTTSQYNIAATVVGAPQVTTGDDSGFGDFLRDLEGRGIPGR